MEVCNSSHPKTAPGEHLPGLDALRGLAAIGVMCHHLEQSRLFYKLPTYWNNIAIGRLGGLCVSFFFVLSGFLITYLLMAENEKWGRINLKQFYMRRVLRIWPLYFVITILGFFIIPHITILEIPGQHSQIADFWEKLGFYVTMSAHLATTFLNPPVPYSAVLWSVGVEEWFYAFWPLIFLLPGKWLVRVLLTLIPVFAFFRWHFRGGAPFYFFSQVRFDCMAIGGLTAVIFRADRFRQISQFLDLGCRKDVWTAVLAVLAGSIAFGVSYGIADELAYGVLFSLVMVGAARAKRGGILLNNSILRFAGRVSYGTYCYNWITLVIALLIINQFGWGSHPLGHVLHYILGFGITFGVAALSFRWIEQPFLRLKDRKFQPGHSQPGRPVMDSGKELELEPIS